MRPAAIAALCLAFAAPSARAGDLFERLVDPAAAPYRITGRGFVTDDGHPRHPGDVSRYELEFRLDVDPEVGEARLEFETADGEQKDIDRYFWRRGRLFQVDEAGQETDPERLGDLGPATVAALHPVLVAGAVRELRANLGMGRATSGGDAWLLAWNDALWSLDVRADSVRIAGLERRVYSDVRGDGVEAVHFAAWPAQDGGLRPGRVVVTAWGRETARLDFAAAVPLDSLSLPAGDRHRDRSRIVAERDLELRGVAPHLFAIDIAAHSTRVLVAEFTNHLVVLEGAYNSRICDRVAALVQRRLGKPVRWFAFSHLHGQYIGGTRSWVHAGASVLVPPTTKPLVESVVAARHDTHPDALGREPRPLRLETVDRLRRLEDGMNALEIHNVESGHTDEYFIFWFPRQKVLLSGDLLFYRPGKPLTGRSKQLCATIARLGLDVETCIATWPLDGYGTRNVVTGAELREACAASQ